MNRRLPIDPQCYAASIEKKKPYFPLRKHNGGWGEIRTHGELAPTAVFKTAALNHSATHP